MMPTDKQVDVVVEARELFKDEPPWFVEVHNARGDYAEIALVRRGASFECGYYVIAKDEMAVRRERTIADFRMMIRARELLKALVGEVETFRRIAEDALRFRVEVNGACEHDEYMIKLCTQCEIRAALNRD